MKRYRRKTGVIAIRIPAPALDEIKKEATAASMSISDYTQQLITRGREWQSAIGEARNLLQTANAEAKRIVSSKLEGELRRRNWRLEHDTGKWVPPGVHQLPADGFIEPTEPAMAADMAVPAPKPKKRRAS